MIDTVAVLEALADPARATEMAAYHKRHRPYWGISNPTINDLTKTWRRELDVDERIAQARRLWATNSHEGRIAAAKLLTQARINPDQDVWALIQSWVPEFDAWAIADHACSAGSRRIWADPSRLDQVEDWTKSDHMWTRRAALVITLPWTKSNNPSAEEAAGRDRILGWAATYVPDREWFIQKAIAWWVRELSKHDRPRAQAFLDRYGKDMKPFARRDAGRFLAKG